MAEGGRNRAVAAQQAQREIERLRLEEQRLKLEQVGHRGGLTDWALLACSSCNPEVTESATLGTGPCGQWGGAVPFSVDDVVGHCRTRRSRLPQLAPGGMQQHLPQGVATLPALGTPKRPACAAACHSMPVLAPQGCLVAAVQAQDAGTPLLPGC